MARYTSGEKRYQCCRCPALCTQREMKRHEHYTWILSCPGCGLDLLTVHEGEVVGVVSLATVSDFHLHDP